MQFQPSAGGGSGSQVLAGGVSGRQPPPPTRPPLFGKQGNSRSLSVREELGGGARAPDAGIQKPYWWLSKGRGPANLDWFAPWIDSTCPDGRCLWVPRSSPRGRVPAPSGRARARAVHAGAVPARLAAYTRRQWASRSGGGHRGEAGRGQRGSMAASVWLRGAASGLRYWSRRQRPAAASLAAGKDLAPPLPVPPPAARLSRPDGRRALFYGRRCGWGRGSLPHILAGPGAWCLAPLCFPLIPLPRIQVNGVQRPFRGRR